MTAAGAASATAAVPWRRGLAWLLFLGPFFFLSYGFANHVAAERNVTDTFLFEWERGIPFIPWTIIPYWSIDLFYGLSFLLCRDRQQVDRHALRLLTVQIISVICFLLFPLHFSFERPAVVGFFGAMFDALMGFDKPYNQAPSLHIGLLVIIWARFAAGAPRSYRWLVHAWTALIALSVLTTYQHHFIDIPTGALVGFFCLWLWPDSGRSPLADWLPVRVSDRRRLAIHYGLGALAAALVGIWLGGGGLWLLWLAAALGLVGLIYAVPGAHGFQKEQGRHSAASFALLAPYLAVAWINSRLWTFRRPQPDLIADGVWLGRIPSSVDMQRGGYRSLVDLTAEMPAPSGDWQYFCLPWLDLVAPEPVHLAEAAQRIEQARRHGPVLVCCALGYSRSASAVAAWLLLTGRVPSVEAAESLLRSRRAGIVLGPAHRRALAELAAQADLLAGEAHA